MANKVALYPGSFDPITRGHLDIIKRSVELVDELIIGVFKNSNKTNAWFTDEEKVEMIEEILKKEKINAKVILFNGLLVDFIEKEKINILIRGLRALSDFEYELQFDLTNKTLAKSKFETIFLNANREYLYLSSSLVKEIAINNGSLSTFVNKNVEKKLIEKTKNLKNK